MTSQNKPSPRLFIGSLPYKFSEGELLSLFIKFGRIVAVKIVHNQWGKSRGLGYVEFDNLDSAITAKTEMHNFKIGDRTIIVDFAQPDPFNTPEGQQRHVDALARRGSHRQNFNRPNSEKTQPTSENSSSSHFVPRPAFGKKSKFSKKNFGSSTDSFGHSRQSVYDSRHHGSRVGAKFAHRSKKKTN